MSYSKILNNGNEVWYNDDGEVHRDGDEPAIICLDGSLYFYKNGKRHRDGDNPAIIHDTGEEFFYKDGKMHRTIGPAFSRGDYEEWWYEGHFIAYNKEDFEKTLSQRGIFLEDNKTCITNKDVSCKQCSRTVCNNDDTCWWCCCSNPGK